LVLFISKEKKKWCCFPPDPNHFLAHFDGALLQSRPSSINSSVCAAQAGHDLRMVREDEAVDAMEIDGHRQPVGAPAAVPEGFNADYLRVYYGKVILSVQLVRAESLRDFGLRRSSLLIHAP
jgi:hypothetical protein